MKSVFGFAQRNTPLEFTKSKSQAIVSKGNTETIERHHDALKVDSKLKIVQEKIGGKTLEKVSPWKQWSGGETWERQHGCCLPRQVFSWGQITCKFAHQRGWRCPSGKGEAATIWVWVHSVLTQTQVWPGNQTIEKGPIRSIQEGLLKTAQVGNH